MFDQLAGKVQRDKDLPERAWRNAVLRSVLDGSVYDVLGQEFHTEKTDGGEYVPLRDRKPSVRYNLCNLVVCDSLALLFGDAHFPGVDLLDQERTADLAVLMKEARLPGVMLDAAYRGSVGSVAIHMRVLKSRLFFDVMDTDFLTPAWQDDAPDTLESVTERRKVKGEALAAAGYDIAYADMQSSFWFQRIWDATAERWFVPLKVGEKAAPVEDKRKSVVHDLGFVPMVWIANLRPTLGVDGVCTFRPAIETQIEIEYQLSQAGRGLKYSSDPLLIIREPASPDGGAIIRSAGNALVVSEDGDAKMLEIDGRAAAAVIDYVKALREMALESVHGNRSSADRISAAQSGKALELMHQPLIWLADRLRTCYGDNGLLPLIRMVCGASSKSPLKRRNGADVTLPTDVDPVLRWPAWFEATGHDRNAEAQALATLSDAGHISRQTAVKSIAPMYDVEDVDLEMTLIAEDEAAADARALAQGAQVKAAETLPV